MSLVSLYLHVKYAVIVLLKSILYLMKNSWDLIYWGHEIVMSGKGFLRRPRLIEMSCGVNDDEWPHRRCGARAESQTRKQRSQVRSRQYRPVPTQYREEFW